MRLFQSPALTFRYGYGSEDDRPTPTVFDTQGLSGVALPERYLTAFPDDLDLCVSHLSHCQDYRPGRS
jgi:hypothetical protein